MTTNPVTPVNLWSAVRSCSGEQWRSSAKWLAYTVGCGFLPVVIGLVVVAVIPVKPVNWYDFVVHGELVIYSAAMIAGSTRLISKDTDTFPFVHREMFTLVAIFGLVICIALYSGIKTAILLSLQAIINDSFIARVSVILLLVSLVFSFLVFLLDQQRINPNINGIMKRQRKELDTAFDRLESQ
jgi:hypothetical protein